MNRNRVLVLLAAVVAASLPAAADTFFVDKNNGGCNDAGPGSPPVPFCKIQVGYNRAADGDEVRVAPGTYGECLYLFNLAVPKNVNVVASAWLANPPNNTTTIIDGTLSGACVFPGGADPASLVNLAGRGTGSKFQGFTVQGATTSGIFGVGSVAITNNVVRDNASTTYGGGIYIYTANCYYGDTTTTITDNQILRNDADQGGGGIAVAAGLAGLIQAPECTGDGNPTVTIENNTIDANTALASGGGVNTTIFTNSARTANVVITNNMITGNSAGSASVYGYGGGVYGYTYGYGRENLNILENTIAGNTTTDLGGGISISSLPNIPATSINHQLHIEDNSVTGNTGERGGGGIDMFVQVQDLLAPQAVRVQASRNTVTGNFVTLDDALDVPNFSGGGGISAQVYSLTSNSPNLEMTLQDNRVSNNSSKIYGGGVSLRAVTDGEVQGAFAPARATIGFTGNRVTQNSATSTVVDSGGGGVFAYLEAEGNAISTIDMKLNTIAGNTLDNLVEAGGIHAESFTISDTIGQDDGLAVLNVSSSIIANNDGVGLGGPTPGQPGFVTLGGNAEFTAATRYNDFFGNDVNLAPFVTSVTGDVFTDPLLSATTFVPMDCSPTIDAADPALDFSLEPAPNGGRANMGHTGGTAQATKSLADISGDGVVDGIDVVRLSVAFGSVTAQPRFNALVDFDQNGMIDGVDLALLAGDFGQTCSQ